MAAANTYTPILTQTFSGSPYSVTLTSFPSTYTDLRLVITGNSSSNGGTWGLRMNGDTAANYSWTNMEGYNSVASSTRGGGSGNPGLSIYATSQAAITGSAEAPSQWVIDVMNYSNSTTYKTILGRASAMGAYAGTAAVVGIWRNTAAITSLTLMVPGGASLYAGTLTLYGILAA